MCILCVVQKWSRRVATMLPWLVIPLIGLWAFSQLFPPAFRFEITSPRLACVFVLLITLFWYEVLMPQLSIWRARRNAWLREKKRSEAIEMQKLRKMAKRRCRNCLTPYRDQNPGAGRFTCTYCGHVSKRPVLDLPVSPGLSNSGILKGLVGKGGKLLNTKSWSDNGWLCGQNGLENGNWLAESFSGKPSNWQRNEDGFFSGDDCMDEKSCSRVLFFAWKNLMLFFWSIGWVWRKITRVTSSRDNASDAEHNGVLVKPGENGTSYNESRVEKARRKAEEKRQARLERELLEQEERKQREEVARLVEERRKLRDEKIAAEKDYKRSLNSTRDREMRKEAEKKRQEKRKEKDKWSSKNNSDAEELEKRTTKEKERVGEHDRQEHQRTTQENSRKSSSEMSNSITGNGANNHNRGNAGTRYLDRMKGSFLSSSKALSRRESSQPVKSNVNGEAKTINRPVLVETQPPAAPKKSWQQLFTRSSAVPPSTNPNIISRPNGKLPEEVEDSYISGLQSSARSYDNPIDFGLPSLFSTFPYAPTTSSPVPCLTSESLFPRIGEPPSDFLPDESEIFQDPCYVPNPVYLLGPVSELLNDFQSDHGVGFPIGEKRVVKNTSKVETKKPSPIQSPFSRTGVYDETHTKPNQSVSSRKSQDVYISPMKDLNLGNEKGTWQMWGTSPLGQDTRSWLLPAELNGSTNESKLHPMFQKTATSLFTEDNQVFSNAHSPQKVFPGNCQNSGSFATHVPCSSDDLLQKTLFGPMTGSGHHLCLNQREEVSHCPSSSALNVPLEASLTSCWAKKESEGSGGEGGMENSSVLTRPHIGGLYSSPEVQSLWAYD